MRVGILISGSGSNMLALVDGMQTGQIDATPVVVISSEPDAGGLAKAAGRGVPVHAVDWRENRGDRAGHDDAVQALLDEAGVDLVVCAGYMRIMSEAFVARWEGRMLNIHPSILPAFKGLNTHARALEAGCAVHGCSVHEVVPELDSGRILGQGIVPVLEGDTADSLAARVLRVEHRLYPAALAAFVRDPVAARRTPIAIFETAG